MEAKENEKRGVHHYFLGNQSAGSAVGSAERAQGRLEVETEGEERVQSRDVVGPLQGLWMELETEP